MKKYAAVIFDWDGTVMDSTHSIVVAIQAAARDLGLEVPESSQASWVIGLSLESALYRCVPQLDANTMPKFLERYRHHYFGSDHEQQLFDGIGSLLSDIKQQNVRIAVATGKSRVGLNRSLGRSGLEDLFDATRTADETRSKPDPKMLFELLEEFMLEPNQVLMVGDTTHDINMAHNAGVDSLAVTYGAHDPDTLHRASPTVILNTVDQMREWVMPRLMALDTSV